MKCIKKTSISDGKTHLLQGDMLILFSKNEEGGMKQTGSVLKEPDHS